MTPGATTNAVEGELPVHWMLAPQRLAWLWVVFLSVLVFRRPDQFLAPYIWVEDGTINLPDFLAHGWSFVAHPIVGYISLPIRVIFGLATSLSFRWLPEIAFVLAMLFAFGIVAAVACSPTALRHRFLCATAMLVIPTNPEVFGSVGAIQPALKPDEGPMLEALAKKAREKGKVNLRLVTSTEDYFRDTVKTVSKHLESAGVEHEYLEVAGNHGYEFNRGPGGTEMLLWHDRVLRGRKAL